MKVNLDTIPKIGERVEHASRFVSNAERLLDVGCGDGIISFFIKNRVEKIYGLDMSSEALKIAEKRGFIVQGKIDFDKNKFPFENNFFDTVTCLDVIEHVKDPRKLLNEIYRVLKKDGKLILSTPNIRFTDHLYKLLFKGTFPKTSEDSKEYDGGHLHFFTFSDIRNLLINTGFKVIKEKGIINKKERGWKGRLFEKFLGKRFMLEFRTPGILVIAQK